MVGVGGPVRYGAPGRPRRCGMALAESGDLGLVLVSCPRRACGGALGRCPMAANLGSGGHRRAGRPHGGHIRVTLSAPRHHGPSTVSSRPAGGPIVEMGQPCGDLLDDVGHVLSVTVVSGGGLIERRRGTRAGFEGLESAAAFWGAVRGAGYLHGEALLHRGTDRRAHRSSAWLRRR